MGKYNFDNLVNRKHTTSFKWDVKDNELPMWVADMDFHVLPEIKEAIHHTADIDAYGYVACPKEYFEAYQSWWERNHNVDLGINNMIYCQGVVAAIDSIFKHVLPKGSAVVVQTPVYHVFFNCIRNNGLTELDNELIYDNGQYKIDFDNLEQLLSDKNTSCLLLCNPHNPVGRNWAKEELKKISDLCKKHDVLLVVDEIHCDITKPGTKYNSIYTVTDDAIALLSPTKAFNVAGIQCACIVCKDKNLFKQIEEGVGQDDVGECNYFSAQTAIAAFTYGDEWIKEMNEYVFNNQKYMMEFIKKELPELKLIDNEGTYLLWLDVSAYTSDSGKFASDLREKTGLFLSPGSQFGKGGETFLRVNVATSLKNVIDACKRLQNYVKTLQK